ncbi:hypothetical protein GQX74_002431 [Glossina fuscipes]|nr:hypothetical protein GQX74_002431 [Glossina fuscipes]
MFVLPRVPRKLLPPGDIGGPNKVGLPIATGDGKEGLRAPDAKGGGLGAGADQAFKEQQIPVIKSMYWLTLKDIGSKGSLHNNHLFSILNSNVPETDFNKADIE